MKGGGGINKLFHKGSGLDSRSFFFLFHPALTQGILVKREREREGGGGGGGCVRIPQKQTCCITKMRRGGG